jgi:hypothetical protein
VREIIRDPSLAIKESFVPVACIYCLPTTTANQKAKRSFIALLLLLVYNQKRFD